VFLRDLGGEKGSAGLRLGSGWIEDENEHEDEDEDERETQKPGGGLLRVEAQTLCASLRPLR